MKNMYNLFMGSNELIIIYRNGTHHVIEKDEDYNEVFTGSYEKCCEYCKNRNIDYLESFY